MQASSQPVATTKQLKDADQGSRRDTVNCIMEMLEHATTEFLQSVLTMYESNNTKPPFHHEELKRIIMAAISPTMLVPNYNFPFSSESKFTDANSIFEEDESQPNQERPREKEQELDSSQNRSQSQKSKNNLIYENWPMNANSFKPLIAQRPVKVGIKYQPNNQNSFSRLSNQIQKKKLQRISPRIFTKNEDYPENHFQNPWGEGEADHRIDEFNHLKFNEQLELGKLVVAKCEKIWSVKKCQITEVARHLAKNRSTMKTQWVAEYLRKNETTNVLIETQISPVCASVVTTFGRGDQWGQRF